MKSFRSNKLHSNINNRAPRIHYFCFDVEIVFCASKYHTVELLFVPYGTVPYVASVVTSFRVHAFAARDMFCPHGRTYFNVFRTTPIQFCPHGSVGYTVNDNP